MKDICRARERPIHFLNDRGQFLSGVLHLPLTKNLMPAIVMAHGFTDDKTGDNRLFVKFARAASVQGYAVLRFDFAGSGDSEGDFCDMTLSNEIEDLKSVLDFLETIPRIDRAHIDLIGYSLGGAVSVLSAAQEPRIRRLIGWAPALSLEAVFKRVLGLQSIRLARRIGFARFKNGDKQFLMRSSFFENLKAVAPLLHSTEFSSARLAVIQGLEDKKVLPAETRRWVRKNQALENLILIPGAGHSFAFFEHELFQATFRFLLN